MLPAAGIREALDRLDLGAYFENVGTSAVFGPAVTHRVVRRVAAARGAAGREVLDAFAGNLADVGDVILEQLLERRRGARVMGQGQQVCGIAADMGVAMAGQLLRRPR